MPRSNLSTTYSQFPQHKLHFTVDMFIFHSSREITGSHHSTKYMEKRIYNIKFPVQCSFTQDPSYIHKNFIYRVAHKLHIYFQYRFQAMARKDEKAAGQIQIHKDSNNKITRKIRYQQRSIHFSCAYSTRKREQQAKTQKKLMDLNTMLCMKRTIQDLPDLYQKIEKSRNKSRI